MYYRLIIIPCYNRKDMSPNLTVGSVVMVVERTFLARGSTETAAEFSESRRANRHRPNLTAAAIEAIRNIGEQV